MALSVSLFTDVVSRLAGCLSSGVVFVRFWFVYFIVLILLLGRFLGAVEVGVVRLGLPDSLKLINHLPVQFLERNLPEQIVLAVSQVYNEPCFQGI